MKTLSPLILLPLAALATPSPAQVATNDGVLTPDAVGASSTFGECVAVDGDRALVGDHADGTLGNNAGTAYLFEFVDGAWVEVQQLFASDGNQSDWYGIDVALDGDRALVGAKFKNSSLGTTGAAYLYERSPDGTWLEVAKLEADEPTDSGHFGQAVDLDGDRAVVGSFGVEGPEGWGLGAVYVYERQPDGTWPQTAELQTADLEPGERLVYIGWDVSLDGDRVLAGAPSKETAAGEYAGAAYLYQYAGGTWTEVHRFDTPAGFGAYDFGQAVALAGSTVVIGDPSSSGILLEDQGRAFVFEQERGLWPFAGEVSALQPLSGDEYGSALAATSERIAVGAHNARPGNLNKAGEVTTFVRGANGEWRREASWVSDTLGSGTELGKDVALDEDRMLAGIGKNASAELVHAFELGSLLHGPTTMSASALGSQDLLLRAGPDRGGEGYFLLGSLSGTSPGLPVPGSPGLGLPLNFDAYFQITLAGGPFLNQTGTLDADGHADAALALPPVAEPAFAGLHLHHAYVTFDPGAGTFPFASNAVPLVFEP